MAEEAFALSPINARPNLPGEADYEAIREAFMETARGRWFLAEYTKRNRNADTNLLLDAVARLETNLADQKQQPQALSLTAALGAIRAAIRQAKATAIEVLPRSTADDTQTAARNGARIIREIATTMRECGADSRICDLLDTQVAAIEAAQQAMQAQVLEQGRDAVLASFDTLMERIEALADAGPAAKAETAPVAEKAAEPREASVTPLFPAPASEPSAPAEPPAAAQLWVPAEPLKVQDSVAVPQLANAPAALHASEALDAPDASNTSPPGTHAGAALAAAAEAMIDPPAATPYATMTGGLSEQSTDSVVDPLDDVSGAFEVEDAEDLAILDAVAMEMGAIDLDDSDPEELFAPAHDLAPRESAVTAPPRSNSGHPSDAEAAASPFDSAPRSTATDDQITLAQVAQAQIAQATLTSVPPVVGATPLRVTPEPQAPAPSLGAALIANGVIADPAAPAADPLAPIRRMTQAEKIAFFS